MRKKVICFILIMSFATIVGCANDKNVNDYDNLRVKYSCFIRNCLSYEDGTFVGGLMAIDETFNEKFSINNVCVLKSQLDMFLDSNWLGILINVSNGGNIPDEMKDKIINNDIRDINLKYRAETLSALKTVDKVLASFISQSDNLSQSQIDWYMATGQKLAQITELYRDMGNYTFLNNKENRNYIVEKLNELHILNEAVIADSTEFSL